MKNIIYNMDDSVTVKAMKAIRERIKEMKQNPSMTGYRIEDLVREHGKTAGNVNCSSGFLRCEVTSFDNEEIVHVITPCEFLQDDGDFEHRHGFAELFFAFQGNDVPIIRTYRMAFRNR